MAFRDVALVWTDDDGATVNYVVRIPDEALEEIRRLMEQRGWQPGDPTD